MRLNKLKLNPDQSMVLRINRMADWGIKISPVFDEVTVHLKSKVCNLEVLLCSLENQ